MSNKTEQNQDKCDKCKGEGFYPDHDPNDPHEDGCSNCPIKVECEECCGTGIKGMHQCQYCGIMTTQPDHECYKYNPPMTAPTEPNQFTEGVDPEKIGSYARTSYAPTEQTGWTYQEGILGFDVLQPNGEMHSSGHIKGTAIDICYRFNLLDALEKLLSEAEELPNDDDVDAQYPDIATDYYRSNMNRREGAYWMRSRLAPVIAKLKEEVSRITKINSEENALYQELNNYNISVLKEYSSLQSQLSDNEKEIERMREALVKSNLVLEQCDNRVDTYLRRDVGICIERNKSLLTPKQG